MKKHIITLGLLLGWSVGFGGEYRGPHYYDRGPVSYKGGYFNFPTPTDAWSRRQAEFKKNAPLYLGTPQPKKTELERKIEKQKREQLELAKRKAYQESRYRNRFNN